MKFSLEINGLKWGCMYVCFGCVVVVVVGGGGGGVAVERGTHTFTPNITAHSTTITDQELFNVSPGISLNQAIIG